MSATAGTLSANVSWTPADATATSFTVVASPGGYSATVDGTSTKATVTGLGFGMSYTFKVNGSNSSGSGPASAASNAVAPAAPGGPYHDGGRAVLLNSDITSTSPLATNFGDDPVHLPGLSAVVLNVTVTQATAAGNLQLVVNRGVVQTIFLTPGGAASSLAVIAVPAQLTQGAIQLTAGKAHVQLDLVGFFTTPKSVRDHSGLLRMTQTQTLFDSDVAAGTSTDVQVLGQGTIPTAHVGQVLVNLTAIAPAGAGSLALRPSGATATNATNLGFTGGRTGANRAIVSVGANGAVTLVDRLAAAHARIDVLGWFSDATDPSAIGSFYSPLAATRLVDTAAHGGPVAPGSSQSFAVSGQGGAPAGTATAPTVSALLQVTAVGPAGAGSVAMSGTPVVVFAAGQTVSGVEVVQLATDGSAAFTVMGAATNVTIDLIAYFSGELILPGSTKVLTAAQLAGITSRSDNTLTFAPGVAVSPPVRLNDVIAAGGSPMTPDGLLRRVLSISTLGDGSTILGTRNAGIPEALTSFTLDWTSPVGGAHSMGHGGIPSTLSGAAPLMNTNPLPPPPGTSIDPNDFIIPIAQPPVGLRLDLSKLGPSVHNGSELDINDLEVQMRAHMSMDLSFTGTFHLNVAFSVGVRAALQLQLLAEANLLDVPKFLDHFFPIGGPIFFLVGGVFPIEFQPFVETSFEFKLSLAGGLIFNFNLDRYAAVSGGYDGTNFFLDQPVYKDYLTPQQTFSVRPSVQAQAELDFHMEPNVKFYGGLGLIGSDVIPYARATVDPLAQVWWEFEIGVCKQFEFQLNLLFFVADRVVLPTCLTILVFHAPGPRLLVNITPSSATVPRSGTQTFEAGVIGGPHGVSWSINEGLAGGTLTNAFVNEVDYHAPTRAGTYHLHAAANDDPTSSAEATITVPADPPGPPVGVSAAVSGPTSATVTWSPPADDGGVAIIGYAVTASPGGAVVQTNETTTSAIFPSLTPGTAYTFSVTATNAAVLTGVASAPTAPITIPPPGPMSVSPTSINFGNVDLGQSSQPQTVQVTADGVPLAISSVALTGARPGDFSFQSDTCSGQTLQPGGSCSFGVVYTPTVQTAVNASVTITDDDPTSPQLVTLTGTSPVHTTSGIKPVGDIQMLDSQHGYLVEAGARSAFPPAVMATTDGGRTWSKLQTPADVRVTSVGVHFVDANNGFVLACRPSGSACFYLVLATADGGQTWQERSLLPDHVGASSFWFTDPLHGWVIGGLSGPPPPPGSPFGSVFEGLYVTSDGGVTWTRQTLPDPVASFPNCGTLQEFSNGVRFADALNGWTAGLSICYESTAPFNQVARQSIVWATTDGGTTWTPHLLPTTVLGLNDTVQVPGPSQFRVEGAVSPDNGNTFQQQLISSDDGGASFSYAVLPGPTSFPPDVHFVDASNGWMIGSDGTVWRTSDGGSTWVPTGVLPKFRSALGNINATSYTYTRIEQADANVILVTGSVTYTGSFLSAGFVERSTDGGATWTVVLLGDGS